MIRFTLLLMIATPVLGDVVHFRNGKELRSVLVQVRGGTIRIYDGVLMQEFPLDTVQNIVKSPIQLPDTMNRHIDGTTNGLLSEQIDSKVSVKDKVTTLADVDGQASFPGIWLSRRVVRALQALVPGYSPMLPECNGISCGAIGMLMVSELATFYRISQYRRAMPANGLRPDNFVVIAQLGLHSREPLGRYLLLREELRITRLVANPEHKGDLIDRGLWQKRRNNYKLAFACFTVLDVTLSSLTSSKAIVSISPNSSAISIKVLF